MENYDRSLGSSWQAMRSWWAISSRIFGDRDWKSQCRLEDRCCSRLSFDSDSNHLLMFYVGVHEGTAVVCRRTVLWKAERMDHWYWFRVLSFSASGRSLCPGNWRSSSVNVYACACVHACTHARACMSLYLQTTEAWCFPQEACPRSKHHSSAFLHSPCHMSGLKPGFWSTIYHLLDKYLT